MELSSQKRIAASVLGVSRKRVKFDISRLEDIKEAITKHDIKLLIADHAITVLPKRGSSQGHARYIKEQKKKGRRKGPGSRKGRATARLPRKEAWVNKIRSQRGLLKTMRSKKILENQVYRTLVQKAKGGFFRSTRHIKLYIEEHNLAKNAHKK